MPEKRVEPWAFWEQCDREQGAATLGRLASQRPELFSGSTLVSARWSRLSFYRTHRLMELEIVRDHGVRRAFVLAGPQSALCLDGNSDSIHATNDAESLVLTELTVADYARFFFYFIRADDGAFLLIESTTEVGPGDGTSDDEDRFGELTLETARAKAHPLLARGRDAEGRWLFAATIAYNGALFSASIAVGHRGIIEMIDDVPIGTLGGLVLPQAPSLELDTESRRFAFGLDAQRTLDGDLAKAPQLLDQGRDAEALVLADKALATQPGHVGAWMVRGVVAGAAGDLEATLADFNEATRLDPENAEAHRNNALALTLLGRQQEALAQYQMAAELDPDNSTYRWDLGNAYLDLDRLGDALTLADTVSDPKIQAAYRNNLGDRLRALGRKQEALGQYQAALELDPDNSTYRQDLAVAYLDLDRVDDAVAQADKVSDPEIQAAYRDSLGDRLRALGRKQEALGQYRSALELDPDNSTYRQDLGNAYLDLDRVDDAVAQADKVSDPEIQAAYRDSLGDRLRALGRKQEALAQYRAAVKLDPENWAYLRDLGIAYLDVDRVDDAVALAHTVSDPEIQAAYRHYVGRRLGELERTAEALIQYLAAVRLDPANSTYRRDLGNAYLDLDLVDDAVALADRLSDPAGQAAYRNNLGDRLRALGHKQEALTQYQAALELQPDNTTYRWDLAVAYLDLDLVDDAVALADRLPDPTIQPAFRNNLGDRLRERGHKKEALAQYQAALELQPDNPTYSWDLGNAYLDLDRLGDALTLADTVADPAWQAAYRNNLGNRLRALGHKQEALAQYRAAVELQPDNPTYRRDLAVAYLDLDLVDDAVALADRLPDPTIQPAFRNNLGDLLRERGHKKEALAQYQAAVKLDPDNSTYRPNLGNAYLDLDVADDAVAQADKVSDPAGQAAYRDNLGDRLRQRGHHQQALAQYRAAVELAPDNSTYLRNWVQTLRMMGRVTVGLREALAMADNVSGSVAQAAYRVNLAAILRGFGQKDEALAQCRAAVELDPDNWTYRWHLVVTLLHSDYAADAIEEALVMAHMASDPVEQARCRSQLGYWLREFGRKNEALAQHRTVVELDPDNSTYRRKLGSAYLDLDRVDEALAQADRLSNPGVQAAYRDGLADQLRELGRTQQAVTQYEEAVKLAPKDSTYRSDLGIAYLDLDRVDEALAQADRLLDPELQAAYRDRVGDRLRALGRKQEALVQYRAAAELDPDSPIYHWSLASAYLDLDMDCVDDAVCEVRTALALDKDKWRLVSYANGLSRAGSSAEATAIYRQALAESSAETRLQTLRHFGWHLLKIGNHDDAIRLYKNEIENDPLNVELLIGLAVIYVRLGEYDDALQQLERAEDYSLGRPDIASWRGSILLNELGRTEEAIEAYRLALDRKDQGRLNSVLDLANALARAKQWPTAQELFEQAISTPAEPVARCLWGGALLNEGHHNQAIEQFRSCAAAPGIANSYYYYAVCRSYLAWTLGRQNEYADAREEWREAITLFDSLVRTYGVTESSQDPHAHLSDLHTSAGAISERLDEYRSALSAYERAARWNPYSVQPTAAQVSCYVELADRQNDGRDDGTLRRNESLARARSARDRAQGLLRTHENAAPGCLTVTAERLSVAQALVALDDYEGARSLLLETAKYARNERHDGDDSLLEFGLGVVCAKQQNFQKAATHFRRAVSLDPINLKARSNWAECLLRLGSRTEALEVFNGALGITNRHVESLIGLAEVYTAMGDAGEEPQDNYNKSIKYFSKALDMSKSGEGSKMLTPKERSEALYSRGYAHAQLFDAAAPDLTDQKQLWLALKDFRQSLILDKDRDRAKSARDKTAARLRGAYAKKITKGLGSLLIVVLAAAIFVLTQLSFFVWRLPDLPARYYLSLTFGSLLFVMAGVSLPSLLRLKVAGVELEKKSVVEQIGSSIPLGITRDHVPVALGFTDQRGLSRLTPRPAEASVEQAREAPREGLRSDFDSASR
jgi:tetratricopeptide (TPR) repeat protein